jgi:hypothetical protein
MTNAVNLASTSATGFSGRNRIINGAMVIDQRNAGAAVTVTGSGGYFYATDRFINYNNTGTSFTSQQVADAPAGFVNSTKLTFASAISLTTTGEATFQQIIEGYNVADLNWGSANAKTITASFWVKASYTGTFSVGFTNASGTRAYGTIYTISAANTWEYKTVTIPGDTSGTWLTDNNSGLFLRFNILTGSNFQVSSNNAWTTRAGSYNGTDSIYGTKAIGAATSVSAGSTWQVTGVQLEVGTVATPFEREIYSQTLAKCQRYYFKSTTSPYAPLFTFATQTTGSGRGMFSPPVPFRTAPTGVTLYGTAPSVGNGSYSSIVFDRASTIAVMLNLNGSGFTSGGACATYGSGDATTQFDFTGTEL